MPKLQGLPDRLRREHAKNRKSTIYSKHKLPAIVRMDCICVCAGTKKTRQIKLFFIQPLLSISAFCEITVGNVSVRLFCTVYIVSATQSTTKEWMWWCHEVVWDHGSRYLHQHDRSQLLSGMTSSFLFVQRLLTGNLFSAVSSSNK